MNAKERFSEFFSTFQKTNMWRAMLNTREDSPWHREDNVAVHTRMLIDWYQSNLMSARNEEQQLMTLVACLMHDIGKPPAEIKKFSEERGEYRAYHGHELISARKWVDYAMSNYSMINGLLRFNITDVSNIAFFLEHHVPFALKDQSKRKSLKQSILNRTGEAGHRAWLDLLLSDQHGRISDDQDKKLQDVDNWLAEWGKV